MLGILWDGSTRYLHIYHPNREYFKRMGTLQPTCVKIYVSYITFGQFYRQFTMGSNIPIMLRVKLVWTQENIQEQCQRLGYTRPRVLKKTFEASSQDYPGVRQDHDVLPNKSLVVSFPILTNTISVINRNKENFYVDVAERAQSGKRNWGVVFYGLRKKLMIYHRIRYKDITAHSTLDKLVQSIAKYVIPQRVITDIHIILGAGNLWKHAIGKIFNTIF